MTWHKASSCPKISCSDINFNFWSLTEKKKNWQPKIWSPAEKKKLATKIFYLSLRRKKTGNQNFWSLTKNKEGQANSGKYIKSITAYFHITRKITCHVHARWWRGSDPLGDNYAAEKSTGSIFVKNILLLQFTFSWTSYFDSCHLSFGSNFCVIQKP